MNLLRSSGFKESYILGLDKAQEHLRLARKFRTQSIDPWKTHIEEFAALIKPHLDYIERGIRSQDSADKLERLAILEDFRAETQSWLEKQEVSYRRWVNLNFRLSILATPKEKRTTQFFNSNDFIDKLHTSEDWLTNKRLESAYLKEEKREDEMEPIVVRLNQFPEVIIAPQMDGLTGIMALTRMTARRVYLHALENNASHVHGFNHPDWIFHHDSTHMDMHESSLINWLHWNKKSYEDMAIPFHNAFVLRMKNFPQRKRERLELIYYYIVFEQPGYGYGFEYPTTSFLRLSSVAWRSKDLYNEPALLPDWVQPNNTDDVRRFLIEAIDLYDNTARDVFNSL